MIKIAQQNSNKDWILNVQRSRSYKYLAKKWRPHGVHTRERLTHPLLIQALETVLKTRETHEDPYQIYFQFLKAHF